MNKKIINLALAGVALAMGVVIIVGAILDGDFNLRTGEQIRLLAIGITCLGILALTGGVKK